MPSLNVPTISCRLYKNFRTCHESILKRSVQNFCLSNYLMTQIHLLHAESSSSYRLGPKNHTFKLTLEPLKICPSSFSRIYDSIVGFLMFLMVELWSASDSNFKVPRAWYLNAASPLPRITLSIEFRSELSQMDWRRVATDEKWIKIKTVAFWSLRSFEIDDPTS